MSQDYEDARFYASYEKEPATKAGSLVTKKVTCPHCQKSARFVGSDRSFDFYHCERCHYDFTA